MLGDACFDFIDATERAAVKLAEAVHWYSAPDGTWNYGEEIDALHLRGVTTSSSNVEGGVIGYKPIWLARLRWNSSPSRM